MHQTMHCTSPKLAQHRQTVTCQAHAPKHLWNTKEALSGKTNSAMQTIGYNAMLQVVMPYLGFPYRKKKPSFLVQTSASTCYIVPWHYASLGPYDFFFLDDPKTDSQPSLTKYVPGRN
ncbi:hypothetical protein AA313_de0203554 [Arthrobotrys entomopaga]|nr:hypothetical protein AA313_de0203554 [Arthrobotrys entomopaga]